jgi:hypothetical protein
MGSVSWPDAAGIRFPDLPCASPTHYAALERNPLDPGSDHVTEPPDGGYRGADIVTIGELYYLFVESIR